mgnify:FL=1
MFLKILIAVVFIFLTLSFYRPRHSFYLLFILLFTVLTIFQFKTTNFRYEYQMLPAEVDLQIKRMNMFPPKLARMGYILEFKKETMLLNKLQNNFFNILDFPLYFNNYFPYFTIPFFFIGLFYFFNTGRRLLQVLFFLTVTILSFLGKNGEHGPFLIFPFFILFIITGFLNSIKFLRK